MNIDNGFDLLVAVSFSVSHQLGGLGTKDQELAILFRLGEGKSLLELLLRKVQSRIKIYMMNDETGQSNNLTGKYIT